MCSFIKIYKEDVDIKYGSQHNFKTYIIVSHSTYTQSDEFETCKMSYTLIPSWLPSRDQNKGHINRTITRSADTVELQCYIAILIYPSHDSKFTSD